MNNDKMLIRAKQVVVDYFNEHAEKTDNRKITENDVFIVWFCKTLHFYEGREMEYDKT